MASPKLSCQRRARWALRTTQPLGQAAFEYVVVVASVVLIWLAIERSPQGFAAALLRLFDQYKFLISIPW